MPNDVNVSLASLQKHLDETCRTNGWDKNSVTEVFLMFTEQVGVLVAGSVSAQGYRC